MGGTMKVGAIVVTVGLGVAGPLMAQQRTPLLPEKEVAALADELSGEMAKRNLEGLSRLHRQRGSTGFPAAAELVAGLGMAHRLADLVSLNVPVYGNFFWGTLS